MLPQVWRRDCRNQRLPRTLHVTHGGLRGPKPLQPRPGPHHRQPASGPAGNARFGTPSSHARSPLQRRDWDTPCLAVGLSVLNLSLAGAAVGSAAGAQVRALWWGSRVQGGQATEPGPRGGKSATQARPLCDPVCCPDPRSRGHGLAREAGTEGCRAGAVGQRGAWRGQAVPEVSSAGRGRGRPFPAVGTQSSQCGVMMSLNRGAGFLTCRTQRSRRQRQ